MFLTTWMRSLPSTEPDFPRPVSRPDIATVVFDKERQRERPVANSDADEEAEGEAESDGDGDGDGDG